jgi:hypothetical protein
MYQPGKAGEGIGAEDRKLGFRADRSWHENILATGGSRCPARAPVCGGLNTGEDARVYISEIIGRRLCH